MFNTKKASILLIVLWSLCLLSVLAVSLGYGVRQKITLVRHLETADKLHLIARAGIKRAIAELKKEDEFASADALNERWSSNEDAFKETEVGEGNFTISYQYIEPRGKLLQTRYGIVDEERKLNINKAEVDEMSRLFRQVTQLSQWEANSLAASIVDWRDEDKQSLAGGAEKDYYRGLSCPYTCKDAEFELTEELLLIKGIAPDIFAKVKGYITVYGQGGININTASEQVLISLGLNETLIYKIISFRCGQDGEEATADDNVFTQTFNILSKLSQFRALTSDELAQLSRLISDGKLNTRSDNFMIKSSAKLKSGPVRDSETIAGTITCIFKRDGRIRYWHEE